MRARRSIEMDTLGDSMGLACPFAAMRRRFSCFEQDASRDSNDEGAEHRLVNAHVGKVGHGEPRARDGAERCPDTENDRQRPHQLFLSVVERH